VIGKTTKKFKNNKIKFEIVEPKERKIFKKSYSDNFTK